MSNFCRRRARQIAVEAIQKFAVEHDLRATPESIKKLSEAAADAALRDSALEYRSIVELRDDQRGVVIDVEEMR